MHAVKVQSHNLKANATVSGCPASESRSYVLIVEDDAIASEMEQLVLQEAGLSTRIVRFVADAVPMLLEEPISAVVLDYQLPDGDSWQVACAANSRLPRIPVIMVTGTGNEHLAAEALHRRIDGYVKKANFYWESLPQLVIKAIDEAESEEQRRRGRSLFQAIENNTADLIATTDGDGVFRYVSSACHRFFDLTFEELVGRRSLDFVHPDDRSIFSDWLANAEKQSDLQRLTYRLRRRDGSFIWVETLATVVPRSVGVGGVELLYVVRDVTERRLTEEHKRAELEAANEELSAFSYSVSHDLRAPLRIVNGFSELLAEKYDGMLDEEGRHFLATIRKSSDQMNEMIDSFLRLFRLRNEKLRITPIDMNALVEDLTRDASSRNPRLCISIGQLPAVSADSGLIQQVWANLLNNAIKFSQHREPPRVTISAQIEGLHARYSITDNGVGFDSSKTDRLFGLFQRLHGREFEGTGIGLTIVARIVKQHGGTVGAVGALDQGATLSFTLPLSPSETQPQQRQ